MALHRPNTRAFIGMLLFISDENHLVDSYLFDSVHMSVQMLQ